MLAKLQRLACSHSGTEPVFSEMRAVVHAAEDEGSGGCGGALSCSPEKCETCSRKASQIDSRYLEIQQYFACIWSWNPIDLMLS
jgi:hypothetical protein